MQFNTLLKVTRQMAHALLCPFTAIKRKTFSCHDQLRQSNFFSVNLSLNELEKCLNALQINQNC